jgi:hypothetical protein
VENPVVDRANDDTERRQREWFDVRRGGFFHGPLTVQVTGVTDRAVLPMIINETTYEGVGIRGVVHDGQKLVFGIDGRMYLDGAEVTDRCYYFHGALFQDAGRPDGAGSTFANGGPPGDTRRKHRFSHVHPAGALDRNYPRPVLEPLSTLPVPLLRLGDSQWRFSVQEGAFDASGFGEAVFALPDDTMGEPPSGKVQLLWREHRPFAVTVLIPADLRSLETALLDGQDLRRLVQEGLEKFRAAGIRLDVDYFDEKWVVGKSVIRSMDAKAGEGVDFEAAALVEGPGN